MGALMISTLVLGVYSKGPVTCPDVEDEPVPEFSGSGPIKARHHLKGECTDIMYESSQLSI